MKRILVLLVLSLAFISAQDFAPETTLPPYQINQVVVDFSGDFESDEAIPLDAYASKGITFKNPPFISYELNGNKGAWVEGSLGGRILSANGFFGPVKFRQANYEKANDWTVTILDFYGNTLNTVTFRNENEANVFEDFEISFEGLGRTFWISNQAADTFDDIIFLVPSQSIFTPQESSILLDFSGDFESDTLIPSDAFPGFTVKNLFSFAIEGNQGCYAPSQDEDGVVYYQAGFYTPVTFKQANYLATGTGEWRINIYDNHYNLVTTEVFTNPSNDSNEYTEYTVAWGEAKAHYFTIDNTFSDNYDDIKFNLQLEDPIPPLTEDFLMDFEGGFGNDEGLPENFYKSRGIMTRLFSLWNSAGSIRAWFPYLHATISVPSGFISPLKFKQGNFEDKQTEWSVTVFDASGTEIGKSVITNPNAPDVFVEYEVTFDGIATEIYVENSALDNFDDFMILAPPTPTSEETQIPTSTSTSTSSSSSTFTSTSTSTSSSTSTSTSSSSSTSTSTSTSTSSTSTSTSSSTSSTSTSSTSASTSTSTSTSSSTSNGATSQIVSEISSEASAKTSATFVEEPTQPFTYTAPTEEVTRAVLSVQGSFSLDGAQDAMDQLEFQLLNSKSSRFIVDSVSEQKRDTETEIHFHVSEAQDGSSSSLLVLKKLNEEIVTESPNLPFVVTKLDVVAVNYAADSTFQALKSSASTESTVSQQSQAVVGSSSSLKISAVVLLIALALV